MSRGLARRPTKASSRPQGMELQRGLHRHFHHHVAAHAHPPDLVIIPYEPSIKGNLQLHIGVSMLPLRQRRQLLLHSIAIPLQLHHHRALLLRLQLKPQRHFLLQKELPLVIHVHDHAPVRGDAAGPRVWVPRCQVDIDVAPHKPRCVGGGVLVRGHVADGEFFQIETWGLVTVRNHENPAKGQVKGTSKQGEGNEREEPPEGCVLLAQGSATLPEGCASLGKRLWEFHHYAVLFYYDPIAQHHCGSRFFFRGRLTHHGCSGTATNQAASIHVNLCQVSPRPASN